MKTDFFLYNYESNIKKVDYLSIIPFGGFLIIPALALSTFFLLRPYLLSDSGKMKKAEPGKLEEKVHEVKQKKVEEMRLDPLIPCFFVYNQGRFSLRKYSIENYVPGSTKILSPEDCKTMEESLDY